MRCCIKRDGMKTTPMVTETIETCVNVHVCVCVCVCMCMLSCIYLCKGVSGSKLCRVGKMKCSVVIPLLFGSTVLVIVTEHSLHVSSSLDRPCN